MLPVIFKQTLSDCCIDPRDRKRVNICYMHNLLPNPLYHGDVKGVSVVVLGPSSCLAQYIPV